MTWRELIEQLKKYPEKVLDMTACVWMYDDVEYPHSGEVSITSVDPYWGDMPVSDGNRLSINLMRPDSDDSFDRDLYEVVDGHVELYGWMEEREPDMEGFDEDERRITLVTGDWPTYEPNGMNMVDWAFPYQQYNDDMHENEAHAFVATWGGTHLPLASVGKDTPDGRYWCFFDEE